jgi:signal transduction histidine kinase
MMRLVRALRLNRISGQIAVLVVGAVIAIHLVITAAFMLGRPREAGPRDGGPGQLGTLVQVIDSADFGGREPLVAALGKSFPSFELSYAGAATLPDGKTDDHRLRDLRRFLGPDFHATALDPLAAHDRRGFLPVAVQLRDASWVTAQIAPGPPRPWLGPFQVTVLFVVVVLALLGLWAARALTRPLTALASAAENFRLDQEAAPLPERGPEEIRVAAAALNRMRARIRELVENRTHMLAAMGHDLRTPVTRMRLRAEFIEDEALRAQMLRDVAQMQAMIDAALSFLRDGQAGGAASTIDVASTLQTICDECADLGRAVAYQGPAHQTVVAHGDELHRAVANLVDNALRHGETVVLRLRAEANQVLIEVEDDGPGISGDKAAMLEPFVRGDAARRMNDQAGFGLGLPIARAVAAAHGGTLSLHDRTPRGLVARITLPGQPPSSN